MNTAPPGPSLVQNSPMALHSVLPVKVSMATSNTPPPFPECATPSLPGIPRTFPAFLFSQHALRQGLLPEGVCACFYIPPTSWALTGIVLLLLQAKGLCVVTRLLQGKISTQALNTWKISLTPSHRAFLRPSQSRKTKTPRFTHLGTSRIFQI